MKAWPIWVKSIAAGLIMAMCTRSLPNLSTALALWYLDAMYMIGVQ